MSNLIIKRMSGLENRTVRSYTNCQLPDNMDGYTLELSKFETMSLTYEEMSMVSLEIRLVFRRDNEWVKYSNNYRLSSMQEASATIIDVLQRYTKGGEL